MDVVVVLDTSGSMGSGFSEYHYDGEGQAGDRQKIDAAASAIASMTAEMHGADRLGVVTYGSSVESSEPLTRVSELDREALHSRLDGLRADGGTNLAAGMREARRMLADRANTSRDARIIYVTDAMPNLGTTDGDRLAGQFQRQAQRGIYTTFVGVGVDFNTRFTETVATIRGANYYSVASPSEFDQRMEQGFDYMVTPLAYNLSLSVDAEGYEVEAVYGSPNEASDGQLLHVETLFPSRSTGNRSEGSVMLVEVNRTGAAAAGRVEVTARYEDPDGEFHEMTRTVRFGNRSAPHYETSGVRRAVVLTEYASLLRSWTAHERGGVDVRPAAGVEHRTLSEWEQTSVDLRVTAPYRERIDRFEPYFRRHAAALGGNFSQDLAVLNRLQNASAGSEGDGTAVAG